MVRPGGAAVALALMWCHQVALSRLPMVPPPPSPIRVSSPKPAPCPIWRLPRPASVLFLLMGGLLKFSDHDCACFIFCEVSSYNMVVSATDEFIGPKPRISHRRMMRHSSQALGWMHSLHPMRRLWSTLMPRTLRLIASCVH